MRIRQLRRLGSGVFAGAAVIWVILFFVAREDAARISAEGGAIETLSAGVLASGIVIAVLNLMRCRSLVWVSVSLLFFWMYLRELDYQKLFTPRSIESVGFYSSSQVPLSWKVTAAAALGPFVAASLHLLWTGLRRLRHAAQPVVILLQTAGYPALLVSAALAAEKLLPSRFQFLEESAELALASLLVCYILIFFERSARDREKTHVAAPQAAGSDSNR
jgi:hypothetical protein